MPLGFASARGTSVGIGVGAGADVPELGTAVGPVGRDGDVPDPEDDTEAPGVAVAEEPQATITTSDRSPISRINRSGIRNHGNNMDRPPNSIFL